MTEVFFFPFGSVSQWKYANICPCAERSTEGGRKKKYSWWQSIIFRAEGGKEKRKNHKGEIGWNGKFIKSIPR